MRSTSRLLLALLFTTTALALPTPQLHGEGEALDSIFTDLDNGIGYGVEDAEDNIAANIASTKGKGTPLPAALPARRQLDKISNGAQDIGEALGEGQSTSGFTTSLDNADGQLTDGAANIGADVGTLGEGLLIDGGKAVPRV